MRQMSLQSYEENEKKRMEKFAWYACSQVAERINDAPVLKEYIKSKVTPLMNYSFPMLFSSITIGCIIKKQSASASCSILQKDQIVYGKPLYSWRTLYGILS